MIYSGSSTLTSSFLRFLGCGGVPFFGRIGYYITMLLCSLTKNLRKFSGILSIGWISAGSGTTTGGGTSSSFSDSELTEIDLFCWLYSDYLLW